MSKAEIETVQGATIHEAVQRTSSSKCSPLTGVDLQLQDGRAAEDAVQELGATWQSRPLVRTFVCP